MAGEDAGSHCYCGTINPTALSAAKVAQSDCSWTCRGNTSELCGGNCRLQTHHIVCHEGPPPPFPSPPPPPPPAPPAPPGPTERNGWGACAVGSVSAGLKFCDPSVSLPERVTDLISRLTTQEKIDRLVDGQTANARLGIPAWALRSTAPCGGQRERRLETKHALTTTRVTRATGTRVRLGSTCGCPTSTSMWTLAAVATRRALLRTRACINNDHPCLLPARNPWLAADFILRSGGGVVGEWGWWWVGGKVSG
jgi:hypothetical protein